MYIKSEKQVIIAIDKKNSYTDETQKILDESVGIDYVLNYEFKDIKDKLYDDLNRLIKALEIYLYQYVNKINCEKNYQIYKK